MMYIVMDQREAGDLFTEEFNTEQEAIAAAEYQWNHMTRREQKESSFCVIKSVNPDEEAENHYDGDVIRTWR